MRHYLLAGIQPAFGRQAGAQANEAIIDSGMVLLEGALRRGAGLCCLPECFNVFGFSVHEMVTQCGNAEAVVERAAGLARQYHGWVVVPVIEQVDGVCRNRAWLIDAEGRRAGFYDKTHVTASEKDAGITAGAEVTVWETPMGRIGIAICYDVYFSEWFATLTGHGVDVIVLPSLQRGEHEPASEAMLRTRAMDSQAYLLRSSFGCPAGVVWQKHMMFGQSCVVHPDGTFLANAGHYEGMALAEVTLPFTWKRARCYGYPIQAVREFLEEDRRGDLYR